MDALLRYVYHGHRGLATATALAVLCLAMIVSAIISNWHERS